jgi:hypothetical protein
MLKKILLLYTINVLMPLFLISSAYSDLITLHVPIVDDSPQAHLFFHELLETAIQEDGHTPKLIISELPQLRIKHYLDHGDISIYWIVESDEINKKYTPIRIELTNGLICQRILLINKEDQYLYDHVETVEDFRNLNLVGGMGENWFDVKVWKANHLRYKEHSGNWKSIFKMIPYRRDYDYCSRGLNEILEEAKQYPDLAIEKRLVFIYNRDFLFYLSNKGVNAGAKYKDLLEHALKKARDTGLIERLVKKYWADVFKTLNYDKRIKLQLSTPK